MSNFSISEEFVIKSRRFLLIVFVFLLGQVSGQVSVVDFSQMTNLTVYEHNHHAFRTDGNMSITIGTEIGVEYNGTEVFNNNAMGPREYLLFSPDENSTRSWVIYDPDDHSRAINIEVQPYELGSIIYSNDLTTGDDFGYSVKINDWNETIVGAPGNEDHLGAVYLFDLNGSGVPKQKIIPILDVNESNRTKFGASLAVNAQDLFIGSPDANDYTGRVYYFQRNDQNYSFSTEINDLNGSIDEQFGYSLSVSTNGTELGVSSPHLKNEGVGKVSIFSFDGQDWVRDSQFWSSPDKNVSGDSFGYDLALSQDFLVVGAPHASVAENVQGLVYVFKKDDNGTWDQTPYTISADFLSDGDQFGHKVEISGNLVFVGAKYGDDDARTDIGSAYVFEFDGNNWIEKAKLVPPNEFTSQVFSDDLAVFDDFVVIGSTGIGSGVVSYVFEMGESTVDWNLISVLENNETNVTNPSYASIDIAAGRIVVGMPEDSSSVESGGSVQQFSNLGWQSVRQQKFPPFFDRLTPARFVTNEDTFGGFSFDFNATHPFDSGFTWEITDFNLTGGSYQITQETGEFHLQPEEHFNGLLELTIRVSLPEGEVSEVFEIEFTPEPDAPIFGSQDVILPYAMVDDYYSFEINATDVDGDDLTFSMSPSDLGLSFDQNRIVGTPLWSAVGDGNSVIYTIEVEVSDGLLTNQKDFSLQIYKKNSPPRFEDENGSTVTLVEMELFEDFSQSEWLQTIPTLSLVDDDPSNNGFTLSLANDPSHGNVFLDSNASDNAMIIYDSSDNYTGDDNFSVRLTDSNIPSKSYDLFFKVSMLPVNDPPEIISSPSSLSVEEGEEFSYPILVSDPDFNDTYSISVTELPSWLNFDENLSEISGTPKWEDYTENKQFVTIVVEDASSAQGLQEFDLEVIPQTYPPVITQGANKEIIIDEDETPLAWSTLELNAIYPNLETSVTQLEWQLISTPANGQVSWSGAHDAIFVDYVPDGNFTGLDSFIVEVYDPGDQRFRDQIEILVDISSVPDDPVFVPLARFTDAVVGYDWSYVFDAVDGDKNQTLNIVKSVDSPDWLNLSVELKNEKYSCILAGTPKQNDIGNHAITLLITDQIGAVREQSFTVSVIQRNFLPKIDPMDLNEIIVMEEDSEWFKNYPLVLEEEDNQRISWSIIAPPSNGNAEIEFEETGELNFMRFVPDGNFSGFDSIIIEVSDGIASDQLTLNFEVTNVNDPPLFMVEDSFFQIKEGNSFDFDVLFTDGDGLGSVEVLISGEPSWLNIDQKNFLDGFISLSGEPKEVDKGDSQISLAIVDGDGEQDILSIDLSVYVLNHSPVINDGEIELEMTEDLISSWSSTDNLGKIESILVTDLETLTENLIWSISSQATHGVAVIDADGENLIYIPDANYSGLDDFTVEISDESINNEKSKSVYLIVNVNVLGVNDPPVFDSSPMESSLSSKQVVWSDYFDTEYGIRIFDPDGLSDGSHTITSVKELPSWITLNDQGNGRGVLSGKAGIENEGVYRIHLRSTDLEGATVDQSFNLHVVVDDLPPRFEAVKSGIAIENIKLRMNEDEEILEWKEPANFAAINPDREHDDYEKISWSVIETSSAGGHLEVSGYGGVPELFRYVPPPNFSGTDRFVLEMSEGDRSSPLNVEVSVYPVPDRPSIITNLDDIIYVDADDPFSLEIGAEDPDGDNLQFQLIYPFWDTNPWLEIAEHDQEGILHLEGIPKVSVHGNMYNYNVVVLDQTGRLENKPFSIFVDGSNKKPSIGKGESVTIPYNSDGIPQGFDLTELSAFDPEGEPLEWSIPSDGLPANGEVSLVGNGAFPSTLNYVPDGIQISEDTFVLRVSDGRKYDEIIVNAVVLWDEDKPYISQPENLNIYEGESIFEEIVISSNNPLEEFSHRILGAPSWLNIRREEGNRIFINGEAPKGSEGLYEIEVEVTGIRSDTHSIFFQVQVNSFERSNIELFGNYIHMISQEHIFSDPGFIATDLSTGEDVTEFVEISSNEFDEQGISRTSYSIPHYSDDGLSKIRVVRRYESSPLVAQKVTKIEATEPPVVGWSLGENLHTFAKGMKAVITNGLNSDMNFTDEASTWINIHKHDDLVDKISSVLSGDDSSFHIIKDSSVGEHIVVGTFGNSIEVLDRQIVTGNENNIFIASVDALGECRWIKTFGGEAIFSNLNLIMPNSGEILVFASFEGNFEIQPLGRNFDSNINGNFHLSLSVDGKFEKASYLDGFENTDLVVVTNSEEDLISISKVENKENNDSIFQISKFDSDVELTKEIKLSSDGELRIEDLSCNNGLIWIVGSNTGSITFNDEKLYQNDSSNGFLIAMNDKLEISIFRFINSSLNSNIKQIAFDKWGNPLLGLEFGGDFSGFGVELQSVEEKDIAICKLDHESAELIWLKVIGGSGTQEIVDMPVSSSGTVALAMQSDEEIEIDGFKITKSNSGSEIHIIHLASDLGIPTLDLANIELIGMDPQLHRLDCIFSGEIFFELVNAPHWISLIGGNKGNTHASLLIESQLADQSILNGVGYEVFVRAYNIEGDFSVEKINIQYAKSEQSEFIMGRFPALDNGFADVLKGSGRVRGLLSTPEKIWILAVNEAQDFKLNDIQFEPLNSVVSSILFWEENSSEVERINLISSNQLFIVESCLDSSGNAYFFGNFSGEITVGGKKYFSNGGYDLFLLKIDANDMQMEFATYGSTNDDMAKAICVSKNDIFLGADFLGFVDFKDLRISSNTGTIDSVIVKVSKNYLDDIEWGKTLAKAGQYNLTDMEIISDKEIVACGSFSGEKPENLSFGEGQEINGLFLRQFNLDGDLIRESNEVSSARVSNVKIRYSSALERFLVACEFEGTFTLGNETVSSNGGFDLLLFSLEENFSGLDARNFGSTLNDRLGIFELDQNDRILFSGSFFDEIEIDGKIFESKGSSDAFLARIEPNGFTRLDDLHISGPGSDSIDSLNLISPQDIHFIGIETFWEDGYFGRNVQKNLVWNRLGYSVSNPMLLNFPPENLPVSRNFEFSLSTGPWEGREHTFQLDQIADESIYQWVDFGVDEAGELTFSGTAPKVSGSFPFDFILRSVGYNQELNIQFDLVFSDKNNTIPIVSVPQSIDAFQYETSEFNFYISSFDLKESSIRFKGPEWSELRNSSTDDRSLSLFLTPGKEDVGVHDATIIIYDSEGNILTKTLSLKVYPRIVSSEDDVLNEDEESSDLDAWSETWFGSCMILPNSWAYHLELGWIYIQPSPAGNNMWFWLDGWGWFWTSQSLWDPTSGAFLYNENEHGWLFFTDSKFYNYKLSAWLPYLRNGF